MDPLTLILWMVAIGLGLYIVWMIGVALVGTAFVLWAAKNG